MGASPIYMNPGLAQSPAYAGASPIYQPGGVSAAGNQSHNPGLPQSPQYSLNPPPSQAPYSSNQKPYSPVYGQSVPGAGGASSVGRSPGYSPTGMLARGSLGPSPQSLPQHSPAYSPTSLSKYQPLLTINFLRYRRQSRQRRWFSSLQPDDDGRDQSSGRPLAIPPLS